MLPVIKMFSRTRMNDIPFRRDKHILSGGMNSNLIVKGNNIPNGFVVTAEAFRIYLKENNLKIPLLKILSQLDTKTFLNLAETGKAARQLILENELPHKLAVEIKNAHYTLCGEDTNVSVTVHGTATTPEFPFSRLTLQLESFLNIRDEDALINAVHKCFASLFGDKALCYRQQHGFGNADIAISMIVAKVARTTPSSSNTAFTPHTLFGSDEVVLSRLEKAR